MSGLLCVAGFAVATVGIAITFSPGWALIVAGTVLFVAGGIGSRT